MVKQTQQLQEKQAAVKLEVLETIQVLCKAIQGDCEKSVPFNKQSTIGLVKATAELAKVIF